MPRASFTGHPSPHSVAARSICLVPCALHLCLIDTVWGFELAHDVIFVSGLDNKAEATRVCLNGLVNRLTDHGKGSMRVRLRDVADMAGVSSATASLVLNGKAEVIPVVTRERVERAAIELGYRPNRLAQNLRSQSSRTIAVLSHRVLTTPYAGAMIEGAQAVADERDFGVLLVNVDDDEVQDRTVHTVLDRMVDAVVYASMYHRVIELPAALAGMPVVTLNARPVDESVAWVVPDERGGAAAAMRYLLDAGHTRIGWLDELEDGVASDERTAVWAEMLAECGLEPEPKLTGTGLSTTTGGQEAARKVLDAPDPPTALFCFNDRMAAGAAIVARQLGMSIPEDLSLVGFDNQVLVAEAVDPGLTTVQLPHYEMGRWAMEQAFGLLDEGAGITGKRMPCPLVERQSVAPPGRQQGPT